MAWGGEGAARGGGWGAGGRRGWGLGGVGSRRWVGTRPRYQIVCLWRCPLASRHGTSRPSVGPNVFWLCQRSPRMTCPV